MTLRGARAVGESSARRDRRLHRSHRSTLLGAPEPMAKTNRRKTPPPSGACSPPGAVGLVVVLIVAVVIVVLRAARRWLDGDSADRAASDGDAVRVAGCAQQAAPEFQDASCPDVQLISIPAHGSSSRAHDPFNPVQFPQRCCCASRIRSGPSSGTIGSRCSRFRTQPSSTIRCRPISRCPTTTAGRGHPGRPCRP